MVKVASVWIRRAEGTIRECAEGGQFFATFKDANHELARWAQTAPEPRAYDKCDFVVTFEDGEQYEGRFDLNRDHRFGVSLEKHMIDYLTFYAGARQPNNYSKESYERFILAQGDKRDACVRFLGTYELRAS